MLLQLRRLGIYQAPGPTVQPSWRYLPHCLIAALLLRLGLHMFSDFVAYPDELQQYLEQGHKLVFGYGLVFWEWHWGARNYLLPGIVAGLLLPFKWLGIDHPSYYVPFVESVFCFVSLLIPWGLYHFTRQQYGETAGRIALLLGVVNFYLLAFAAKTLTGMLSGVMLAAAMGLSGRPFIRGDAGAWLFGILLGVAAFLRYLYLPALGILWLAVAITMPARWILRSLAGGLLAILAYGLLDFLTWGRMFNSMYMHMLWNLNPTEGFHTGEGEIFYPQRLLFISAGYILFAVLAWLWRPRLHLLTLLMALAIMLPHMLTVHKEFRYIAPMFFLWIPAAAWLLSAWFRHAQLRHIRHDLTRGLIALQLVFGLLVAIGAVKDNWIYNVGSHDKGIDQMGYLHNTPAYFAGLTWLHEQDDLEGLYVNVNNFNYYHLHRDVPIYDDLKYLYAQRKHPDRKFVSHIITYGEFSPPQYVLVKQIGHLKIYKDIRDAPIYDKEYTPMYFEEPNWQNSAKVLPPPIRR